METRPIQEMNATFDADKMDFSDQCPDGFWTVYKGASFDLWNPDTGEYNAYGKPDTILNWLQDKRIREAILLEIAYIKSSRQSTLISRLL